LNKFVFICIPIIFALILFGCTAVSRTNDDNEKFTMNGSVAIGAVDDNNLDKTKITYKVVISGNKEDINNIDAQEPLINNEYIDLMLENGPHNSQVKGIENPYLEITGSFVFDTAGKSKEDIDDMCLFQGIKIIDKNNNEYVLKFKKN
jgi:hypothetical protein